MKAHVMIVAAFISLAALQPSVWAQKIPVASAAELPTRSYQLDGSVREILDDRQITRLSGSLQREKAFVL